MLRANLKPGPQILAAFAGFQERSRTSHIRGQNMLRWLEHLSGALLMLLVLLDVFLTVLYARAGTGLISRVHARWTWRFFRSVSKPFGRLRGLVLSFAGPAILVSLVLLWMFLLAVGAALIIHPNLGASVRARSGHTPTDFF